MSSASAVKEGRLWQRHADMAKLGGTPKGGVNRQALSPEDAAARNLLASWAKARGFGVSTDAIGNLFVRREGTDAKAFNRLGIRCFGFAPLRLPPDLNFSALFHGIDERVPIEGLKFGVRVLDRLLSSC